MKDANLRDILRGLPDELHPIVGVLFYGRLPRVKLLLSDLISYLVHEAEEPLYPGWALTDEKARAVMVVLDQFLTEQDAYGRLGPEVQQLVQKAQRTPLAQWKTLEVDAQRLAALPEVTRDIETYMRNYQEGQLTCFYCGKLIDEGGTDSSTESGIYYGCDADWERFGNPDQYM